MSHFEALGSGLEPCALDSQETMLSNGPHEFPDSMMEVRHKNWCFSTLGFSHEV